MASTSSSLLTIALMLLIMLSPFLHWGRLCRYGRVKQRLRTVWWFFFLWSRLSTWYWLMAYGLMIKYNIAVRHKAGFECHRKVDVFHLLMNSIRSGCWISRISRRNGCYHLSQNIVNTRNHTPLRLVVYSRSCRQQIFVYQALSRGNSPVMVQCA